MMTPHAYPCLFKESAVDFHSKTYNTLLDGKSVKFELVEGGEVDTPEWSRVQIDEDIHILGSKRVRTPLH